MTRPLDVAIASCVELPEPDRDEALLMEALARAGLRSAVLAWDDPNVNFGSARVTVLRSTWNYPQLPHEFRLWLESVDAVTDLWNPLSIVRGNLHKRYLLELEEHGIPVTPTELLRGGSRSTLLEVTERRGWEVVVVKPAISASSMRTIRVGPGEIGLGEDHLRDLLREGDALVQSYLPSVEDHGERALIWIDGRLTHAVRKRPRFTGSGESVSKQSVAIGAEEAELAERAISWALERSNASLLYARVDVAPGAGGHPVVMELELIEPSLYFGQSPKALGRFVDAIRRRLGKSGG